MKTLIVYTTKHGATRRYAEELARLLSGQVTVIDLHKEPCTDASAFDQVVIGSPIYAGQLSSEIRGFCTHNLGALQQKRLGLFACCWQDGEGAKQQLQTAFPEELVRVATVVDFLGGDMNLADMNFLERLAARAIAKVRESASHYSSESLSRFADSLQQAAVDK